MTRDRGALIADLAADARPVRPAASPSLRAAAWLAVTAVVAVAVVRRLSPADAVALRLDGWWSDAEVAATLLTGLAAILAAFQTGVPGTAPRWPWRPLLPLALWMAASVASLIATGVATGDGGHPVRESAGCFLFVLVASLPMAITVLVALRRTRSLYPARTALLAGLGVGALAAFLLAFCHPFALNPTDFAVHLAAVALVVAATTAVGRLVLAIPRRI